MKYCTKRNFLYIVIISMILIFSSLYISVAETNYGLSNPRITDSETVWDCVYFGSYPQTEIVAEMSQCGTTGNSSEISGDCIVDPELYNCLCEEEIWLDNIAEVDGYKFKRVKKSDSYFSLDVTSDGMYNWIDSPIYHYFKFEPIKWRVLNISNNKALLIADKCLDSHEYNNTCTPVTWETSTIRQWLNNSFINIFSSAESSSIIESDIQNTNNLKYGTLGGNNTVDKIFLLSDSEVYNTDVAKGYGFSKENSIILPNEITDRLAVSTAYANSMGAYRDYYHTSKSSFWWLRSPGLDNQNAALIRDAGVVTSTMNYDLYINFKYIGVRPALNIDLNNDTLWEYASELVLPKDSQTSESEDSGNTGDTGNTGLIHDLKASSDGSIAETMYPTEGVSVKYKNGVNVVTIDEDSIKKIIESAKGTTVDISFNFDVKDKKNIKMEIILPNNLVEGILDKDKCLKLSSEFGIFNFDATSLKKFGDSDVKFSVHLKQKKDRIDINVSLNNGKKSIKKFGNGNVDISLELPDGMNDDEACVMYISGKYMIDMGASVKDGKISFNTNHFSTYAIAKYFDVKSKLIKSIKASTLGKIKAFPNKKNVRLTWKNAKGNVPTETIIYRSFTAKKGYKKIAKINDGRKTFVDKSKLKKGRTYYYKVCGKCKVEGKKYNLKKSTVAKVVFK